MSWMLLNMDQKVLLKIKLTEIWLLVQLLFFFFFLCTGFFLKLGVSVLPFPTEVIPQINRPGGGFQNSLTRVRISLGSSGWMFWRHFSHVWPSLWVWRLQFLHATGKTRKQVHFIVCKWENDLYPVKCSSAPVLKHFPLVKMEILEEALDQWLVLTA